MSTISRELGVSKDVVKYHKKTLNSEDWNWQNNQIVISENGVKKIKNRLRKKSYDVNFEKYTRKKLLSIEQKLDYLDDFLLKKFITKEDEGKNIDEDVFFWEEKRFTDDIKGFLGHEFTSWYVNQKDDIDKWHDWRWDFVKISDIQNFFDYKKQML